MISFGQKSESLATLSQGEAAEVEAGGATEAQLIEMAGFVNGRNSIIAALALMLALSVVTNVVFLTVR